MSVAIYFWIVLMIENRLEKLPCLASIIVMNGHPIASRDIIKESTPSPILLDDLVCVISLNIIHVHEHLVVLGLPWFELRNLNIDRGKCRIMEPPKNI